MRKLGWLDFVIYLFIGAIGIFVMISIKTWMDTRDMELFSTTSPLIFPFLIGSALLVFLILTVFSDIRKSKDNDAVNENEEDDKELTLDVGMAVFYSIGVVVYTFVIRKISFLPGTILFLVIAMGMMNYEELKTGHRIGKATVVSLIAVPILYFVFYKVFNVMLP
jgi:predicted membrane channel-forming protein YqfA (hemolysin III family)